MSHRCNEEEKEWEEVEKEEGNNRGGQFGTLLASLDNK